MSNNQPLVSVIVPVYRAEKWIRQCVDSLLGQSYRNIEVILVDDGSPDRSGAICDEYAAADSRVKVIHQPNGGVNIARKNGFVASTGEWIMFVDADDTIPQNAIELLLMNSDGVDLVSGKAVLYRDGSTIAEEFPEHIKETGDCDGKTFVEYLLLEFRLCSLWRQLIHRDMLSERILMLSPEITCAEDFIINLRVGFNLRRVRGINEIVYNYRYFQGNTITSFQMTSDYLDRYDRELLDNINPELRGELSEQIFHYRLNWLLTNLGVEGICNTNLAKSICAENKRKYRISLRKRFGIILLYVHSSRVRIFLWNSFQKMLSIVAK